jgi:hypothetical protein
MATYPSGVKSFTTKVDGAGNLIAADHVNALQAEVVAVETDLLADWVSYTPVWTNAGTANTVGNAVLTGQYKKIGKVVLFKLSFSFGTTSVAGNGAYLFSLPVASAAFSVGNPAMGSAQIRDASVGDYAGSVVGFTDTTCYVVNSNAVSAGVSGLVPMTWVATDYLSVSGMYIAASL